MTDTELYRQLLGIVPPWQVSRVELNVLQQQVRVHVTYDFQQPHLLCPECGQAGSLQFTCDYATMVGGKRVYLRRDKISQTGRSNQNGAIALTLLTGQAGLLLNGRDAKFDAGTSFTLYVDQDAALAPVTAPVVVASPPTSAGAVTGPVPTVPMTLFTLADGSQVAGRLVSFDGTNYVVTTAAGNVSLGTGAVKSMNVLPSAPVTAAPAVVPAPASKPTPKLAPRLPVISTFPQHVHVELTDGNSYFGSVTSIDGAAYSILLHGGGVLNVDEARIKTLELLPAGD